ncbi:MAG: tripartite tricarboxylate transporter TctB family protein [Rubrobacteraceae bacterium]
MRERLTPIIPAALALLLAVSAFVVTFGFPPPAEANDPGAAAFPRLVAAGLAGLAVIQLATPGSGEDLPTGGNALRVAGVLVLLLVYSALLEPLGFILATVLFLFATLLLAEVRNPLPLALIPVGVSALLFYLFYELLRVSLPTGVIEGALPL